MSKVPDPQDNAVPVAEFVKASASVSVPPGLDNENGCVNVLPALVIV
jgi:hypothetical protein